MADRDCRPSYTRALIGVAICVYAIVKFAWQLDHPNYIGFIIFLVVGALLVVSGLLRNRTRRDWVKDEYAKQLAADGDLKRTDTKVRLFYVAGWAFILLALAWVYYGTRRFGPNQLAFTLGIAACIALPGWLLMAYRSIVTGIEEFRAIRRARERLSNEKRGSGSEQ